MNRNDKVRLQIMLIALIGGLALVLYLVLNLFLTIANANRLDELQQHHYPLIEDIRALRQDLISVREGFAAAVGLGDQLLLQESMQLGADILQRITSIQQRRQLQQRVQPVFDSVSLYLQTSTHLASTLLNDPEQIPVYQAAMEGSLQEFDAAMADLEDLLTQRQELYQALLVETRQAADRANVWAACLGALVIVLLLGLAFWVSRRVLADINESDCLKDEFLATISHELCTPMNGVVGAHSMLQDMALTDDQREWLDIAQSSADNMMNTIEAVLQYSEMAAGKAQPIRKPFTLHNGLAELQRGFRQGFAERGLAFDCIAGDILHQPLLGDEVRVLYVVRQLISNGLKFTEHGGVQLRFEVDNDRADQPMVRVRIEDTGPGIPLQHLARLQQPFNQLDGSFSRRHQGMGIGLATCMGVANLLGGSLSLQNGPQGGVTADFCFPVELPYTENSAR